jgi:hypothetical protein
MSECAVFSVGRSFVPHYPLTHSTVCNVPLNTYKQSSFGEDDPIETESRGLLQSTGHVYRFVVSKLNALRKFNVAFVGKRNFTFSRCFFGNKVV